MNFHLIKRNEWYVLFWVPWGKPSFFRNYDSYKTEVTINGIVPVPLPKLNNVDIDDIDDWNIAEAIFIKFFQNK